MTSHHTRADVTNPSLKRNDVVGLAEGLVSASLFAAFEVRRVMGLLGKIKGKLAASPNAAISQLRCNFLEPFRQMTSYATHTLTLELSLQAVC